jgi:hypothetical protein
MTDPNQPYSAPAVPPNQPYQPVPPQQSYNVLAIVGFVLSFFTTIIGLIISIIAFNQIKKTGEKGRGFALAGIIISAVAIVLGIILTIVFSIVAANIGTSVN